MRTVSALALRVTFAIGTVFTIIAADAPALILKIFMAYESDMDLFLPARGVSTEGNYLFHPILHRKVD